MYPRITNNEIDKAMKIVDILFNNGLADAIHNRYYESELDNNACNLADAYGIEMFSGATKYVFSCTDLENWVIKIDQRLDGEHWCRKEAETFLEAIKFGKGVEECFAATWFLTEYEWDGDVYELYVQEKLECDEAVSSKLYNYVSENYISRDNFDDEDDFNYEVWDYIDSDMDYDDIISALMPEMAAYVWEFVEMYDINDLHQHNYGYSLANYGTYKIIDYCGYH